MKFNLEKIIIIMFIFFNDASFAHTSHYQNFEKIEMEILKDNKVIGYNYYFFDKKNDILTIKNQIRFKVNLLGFKIFNFESYGIEKHKNNKLISYESKTKQNDKVKFVNLFYESKKNRFNIKGSSYTGFADTYSVIGNWWNHQILQANSQISPISGSIKKQVVTFVGKEKIDLYGKLYDVDHFKLVSKNEDMPKNKKLNFDIWFDKKNAMIVKVTYSRMGKWEYKLKSYK